MTTHPPTIEALLAQRDWVHQLARAVASDEAQAADLEQETWLRALTQAPRVVSRPRAWLGRVLQSRAANQARSRATERDHVERAGSHAIDRAEDPALDAEAHETFRVLTEAITRLPGTYSRAVWLRYVEDLPLADVARRLEVSLPAAQSRATRGIQLLRERLEARFGSDWSRRCAALGGGATTTLVSGGGLALVVGLVLIGGALAWAHWSRATLRSAQVNSREAEVARSELDAHAAQVPATTATEATTREAYTPTSVETSAARFVPSEVHRGEGLGYGSRIEVMLLFHDLNPPLHFERAHVRLTETATGRVMTETGPDFGPDGNGPDSMLMNLEGRYFVWSALAEATYTLDFDAPGYQSVHEEGIRLGERVSITLAPKHGAIFELVSPWGETLPAPEIYFASAHHASFSTSRHKLEAATELVQDAIVAHLPAMAYRLLVVPQSGVAFPTEVDLTDLGPNELRSVRLVAPETRRVSGIVRDDLGVGRAGVEVLLMRPGIGRDSDDCGVDATLFDRTPGMTGSMGPTARLLIGRSRTRGNGSFDFEDAPVGSIVVQALEGVGGSKSVTLDGRGPHLNLALELPRMGTVELSLGGEWLDELDRDVGLQLHSIEALGDHVTFVAGVHRVRDHQTLRLRGLETEGAIRLPPGSWEVELGAWDEDWGVFHERWSSRKSLGAAGVIHVVPGGWTRFEVP